MPFLSEQIEIINSSLQSLALSDARFSSGRFEAIAVDVSRKDADTGAITTFPAVMDKNYEAQEITVDDTYPIIIYHKILSKEYAFDKAPAGPNQYGDGNRYITETASVKMVVYGKYAALKLTREQLEALITSNFPDSIAPVSIQPLKLDNMVVTLKGSDLNSARVWQEEYKGIPLFLAPEDILFSIMYSIDTRFRKGCINICDCA
jgi:hypothetical protein